MIYYDPVVEKRHVVKLAELNAVADIKLTLADINDAARMASDTLDNFYRAKRDWKGAYVIVALPFESATKVKYVRALIRRYAYDWKVGKIECRTGTNFEGPVLVTPSADSYILDDGRVEAEK